MVTLQCPKSRISTVAMNTDCFTEIFQGIIKGIFLSHVSLSRLKVLRENVIAKKFKYEVSTNLSENIFLNVWYT